MSERTLLALSAIVVTLGVAVFGWLVLLGTGVR